jgi:hypothetical protein
VEGGAKTGAENLGGEGAGEMALVSMKRVLILSPLLKRATRGPVPRTVPDASEQGTIGRGDWEGVFALSSNFRLQGG